MSTEVAKNYQEDEIDLRELYKVIKAKKVFIVLFTSIITLIAAGVVFMKTPIYEVKSNIQIGYIGDALVEQPEAIIKILNVIFNVEDKPESDEKFVAEVTSVSTNKKVANFIEIKTEGISNEEAQKKNKEVLSYIQKRYQSKIEQYLTNTKNEIKNVERQLDNVDNFEKKNIENQIEELKNQKIVEINDKIKRLKEQNIKKLEEQIKILKEQTSVQIDNKIKFLKSVQIPSIVAKIEFNTQKLKEYNESIEKLYAQNKNSIDNMVSTVSSIQMVNYQNLILNSQNNIQNLSTEKESILQKKIPELEIAKKNIHEVTIVELQRQIENIKNIDIVNLKREKENLEDGSIRKLQYKLAVELPANKVKLQEKIDQLAYNMSMQNIKHSEVVGDYILYNHPVKPKKKLIVAVAFVTSLILSIFIVFFLNFIRDEKSA